MNISNPAISSQTNGLFKHPIMVATLFWLVIVLLFVARALLGGETDPLFADSDDAMRMVTALDFLGGQNWFDATQYRDNAPFTANMHWSRLIDAPLAALIWLAEWFVDRRSAIIFAAFAWPLLLLLFLFWLSVHLCMTFMAPHESKAGLLPGLALPVMSLSLILDFEPGSVDHHNVQTLLVLAMLATTLAAPRSILAGALAGLACATSIAIGLETMLFVAVVIVIFGLYFVFLGEKAQVQMLVFGAGFAGFTIAHLFLSQGLAGLSSLHCDSISAVFGVAAALVAAGFGLTFRLTFLIDSAIKRFVVLAVIGCGVLACIVYLFPHCLGGPYWNIDPILKASWLDHVVEALPVWVSFEANFATTLGFVLAPAIGLVLTVWRCVVCAPSERGPWLVLATFLGAAILVMFFQVRGARLAAALALPAGAYAIVAARQAYLQSHKASKALIMMLAWLAFAGVAHAALGGFVQKQLSGANQTAQVASQRNTNTPQQCFVGKHFDKLSELASTHVASPIDIGAHILLYTDHKIVAAPYHRNQMGLLDALEFMNAPQFQARLIAQRRGLTHFVTCPYLAESGGGLGAAPDSVALQLTRGQVPSWFTSLSDPDDVLQIYQLNW